MHRKAFFTVTDYWKTADPKKESIIPIGVNTGRVAGRRIGCSGGNERSPQIGGSD